MKELLSQVGVLGRKTEIYDLSESPTEAKIHAVYGEIEQRIEAGKRAAPMTRFLVFWVFCGRFINAKAGDGVLVKDDGQSFILDEYDEQSGFYKLVSVERTIKEIADRLRNSYHLGFFTGPRVEVRQYQAHASRAPCIELDPSESRPQDRLSVSLRQPKPKRLGEEHKATKRHTNLREESEPEEARAEKSSMLNLTVSNLDDGPMAETICDEEVKEI